MNLPNIRNFESGRPILVMRGDGSEKDQELFDLVCGRGRIEAFMAHGHVSVPELIVEMRRTETIQSTGVPL